MLYGIALAAAELDAEVIAYYVETQLLTNEAAIKAVAKEKPSLARRILAWVDSVLAKLGNDNAEQRAFLTQVREQYRAALQEGGASEGTAYAIGKTTSGKPFVEIEKNILAGVPMDEWVSVVKRNLKAKYPDGVPVGNDRIAIDNSSRGEMTFSTYIRRLYKNDAALAADKLRITNNADEIVLATTDWVGEEPKHPRKDDIVEFARGNVLLRVGQNDYTASVIVGTLRNGSLRLYDILALKPSSFSKKRLAQLKTQTHCWEPSGLHQSLLIIV
ncbi:MAG: hypothetical protein Q4B96_06935 [Bacillota bacterium]|nr:hypothetical protein [Bacillota bacterium]